MLRFVICVVTFLSATAIGSQPVGQFAAPATKAVPPGTVTPPPKPFTITLTVSPANLPAPVLRYVLLPSQRDRIAGNAALHYYRASQLQPVWPRDPGESLRQSERIGKWEAASLDQFPTAEVKAFLHSYANSFNALDTAAKCKHCDWQLDQNLTPEGIATILGDAQLQRVLTRYQRLRIRAALAEHQNAAVCQGLMTGFRQAKDVAEGPTLIHMLVGLALTSIYTGTLEEWISTPDSPNLYWAVTTLPHPFIDPRPAVNGESQIIAGMFPNIQELEKGPVSPERALATMEHAFNALRQLPQTGEPSLLGAITSKLGVAAYVTTQYPDAKKQLVALGRTAAEIEKMPPAQVVALRAHGVYRIMYDDWLKCFSLPYYQAVVELGQARERAAKLVKANETDLFVKLISLTQPAFEKVTIAHARVERRLAGLRVVEAIRLHAATHNGELPRQLNEITAVPVTEDPNTGKPFAYSIEGRTFKLIAPPPAHEAPNPSNNFEYIITLRPAK